MEDVIFSHLVPSSCLCLCTPAQLCLCCCIIFLPLHLWCVHIPKSIPFILLILVYPIHFIEHRPALSYLPYSTLPMLECHSALLSRQIRNTVLLKYIHFCAKTKTHASKSDLVNITTTQASNRENNYTCKIRATR